MTRAIPLVVFLALLVLLAGLCIHFSGSLIDDAYIVFRYADNLLAGRGAVFNPGERVEGFTSPLWLALMALARAVGAGYEDAAVVLGGLFALLSLLPAWSLARRAADPPAALVAPALLAFHPGYAMWSVHGLESALFVLVATSAFAVWSRGTERSAISAGLLFGLALWTRPESLLFAVAAGAVSILRGERARALRLALGFLALALPLEIARLGYYGEPLPNTFFAKTGGLPGRLLFGLSYTKLFLLTHAPIALACLYGAVLLFRARALGRSSALEGRSPSAAEDPSPPQRAIRPAPARVDSRGRDASSIVADALAAGALWTLYVIWVGGDGFFGFRFWLPVLPLAGVVAAWTIERIGGAGSSSASIERRSGDPPRERANTGPPPKAGRPAKTETRGTAPSRRPLLDLSLALAIGAACGLGALQNARFEHDTGGAFTAKMKMAGLWLRENAPRGTLVAANYVGALPFFSGLPTIDMLGLTDPEIARTPIRGRFRFTGHARGNGASVLDRRPDLILMNGVWVESEPLRELSPQLDSEEQIAADPRFSAGYELVNVRVAGPDGPSWFAFYQRRDSAWRPGA